MLTQRFGKEVVNYYAGSRINRYSFLRGDGAFLRKAIVSPSTRFLALSDLSLLVVDKRTPAFLTFDDVKPLVGAEPFGKEDDDLVKTYDSTITAPVLVVFLGTLDDDASVAGEGSPAVELETTNHGTVKGQPVFAIDVTPRGKYQEAAQKLLKEQEQKGNTVQIDPRAMSLKAESGTFSKEDP